MFILRYNFLKRVGFWALLQALPSEAALKTYLKSVFLALCTAVIASILIGALIAAGMIVLYQALVMNGVATIAAGIGVTCLGLLVLALCAGLFLTAIRRMVVIQHNEELRDHAFRSPARRLVDAVRAGLISGYSNRHSG